MMKSAEDAISKIPFVKCEGRQNLDFAVWKKSFATSMGQRYGELLEVNRTAEVFTYTAPIELDAAVVDGKKIRCMERAMHMDQMAEHSSPTIFCGRKSKGKDSKGLMIAVTKDDDRIILA